MAEHGTPHEAHRDRWCSGDRADVQPVQPCDGAVPHPEALHRFIPFQFPVAGIGRQAVAAVFQKAKAPVPVLLSQVGEGGTAADGPQRLLRVETRSAGEAREVLQQHIKRGLRWFALFHEPFLESAANSTEFEQLQSIRGHEQHLGGSARQVCGASRPLQQPRQVLGAADLNHLLHGLEVHPQIQGAGADHPANRAGLHRRFDRLPLAAVDGAVVQSQGSLHLRAGESEALEPAFRLVAGVGEQQCADAWVHRRHQVLVHP